MPYLFFLKSDGHGVSMCKILHDALLSIGIENKLEQSCSGSIAPAVTSVFVGHYVVFAEVFSEP